MITQRLQHAHRWPHSADENTVVLTLARLSEPHTTTSPSMALIRGGVPTLADFAAEREARERIPVGTARD